MGGVLVAWLFAAAVWGLVLWAVWQETRGWRLRRAATRAFARGDTMHQTIAPNGSAVRLQCEPSGYYRVAVAWTGDGGAFEQRGGDVDNFADAVKRYVVVATWRKP